MWQKRSFSATMQVSDFIKMKPNNNTYNSMLTLTRILKVFCLNCNIEEANLKSKFILIKSLFTTIIIGCINFFCLYYKIEYIYSPMDLSVKLTDIVQIIYDFCQYVVDLHFIYKYGRHICVEYFKQYECIDNILHVTCFAMFKRKLRNLMAFFFIMWSTTALIDLLAWALAYGWITPMSHMIAYVFLLIKMLTTLDLVAHVMHIGIRLRVVGDLMLDCYSYTEVGSDSLPVDCVSNKSWLYTSDGVKTQVLKATCRDARAVKSLTSCYLLLTEQASFVNKIYGFRILLNSLSLLFDMIKLTNLAVRMFLGYQKTTYGLSYFPAVSSLYRLMTCAAIFVTLVNQCENAYRLRERIVNTMDHLLINKNPGNDLRTAVVNFRELIQDRPVVFNMANFFILNYTLLMSLASVVVTYTIILLQSVK